MLVPLLTKYWWTQLNEIRYISVIIPHRCCVRQTLCDVVNILTAKNKKQGKKELSSSLYQLQISLFSINIPITVPWSDSKRVGFSLPSEHKPSHLIASVPRHKQLRSTRTRKSIGQQPKARLLLYGTLLTESYHRESAKAIINDCTVQYSAEGPRWFSRNLRWRVR